jgi:sulfate permease, SulP family
LMGDFMGPSANKARKFMWDLSGAFGDIGVLFPIAIALIATNGFNPSALFLAAGLFYIASACYFRITMPVQPLKAMAAIAIASGMRPDMINLAGIIMGVVLIFIAATGLSVALGRIFPVAVVRGIQFGLGLLLIKTSLAFILTDIQIAAVAGIVLIATLAMLKQIPPLIPLLIIGAGIVFTRVEGLQIGFVDITPSLPDVNNLWPAFILLVVPQIALTLGNAVVATEATGKMLYGEQAARLNLRSVPMSMGIANIFSGFLGGAPMCHGSGGITAHRKFGASDARSGWIIGTALIIMAMIFGNASLLLLTAFPSGILGVLLCFVGIQHALFVRDIVRDKADLFVAASVAVVGIITNNLTTGFMVGLVLHYSMAGLSRAIRLFD